MSGHIREDPEISQIWTVNQVNQHDWPKATGKKYPIKLIQTITRAQLRDSPFKSACVSLHMYCTLFSLNKYLFHYDLSLWELFSAKLRSQGVVTEDGLHLWQGP